MRSLWSLPSWRDISCVPGALPSPCERKQDRERKRVLLGSLGPWIQPLLKSRSLKTFQLHGPLNPPVYTGGEGVSFSSFAARVLAPEVSIHGSVSSSHTEHGPAFWRFRGTCRGIDPQQHGSAGVHGGLGAGARSERREPPVWHRAPRPRHPSVSVSG